MKRVSGIHLCSCTTQSGYLTSSFAVYGSRCSRVSLISSKRKHLCIGYLSPQAPSLWHSSPHATVETASPYQILGWVILQSFQLEWLVNETSTAHFEIWFKLSLVPEEKKTMNFISEGIYIGTVDDAYNTGRLKQEGITHILTVDSKPLTKEATDGTVVWWIRNCARFPANNMCNHFGVWLPFTREGCNGMPRLKRCSGGHSRLWRQRERNHFVCFKKIGSLQVLSTNTSTLLTWQIKICCHV